MRKMHVHDGRGSVDGTFARMQAWHWTRPNSSGSGRLLGLESLDVLLHVRAGQRLLRHLHNERLDVLAVFSRPREGQPHLEGLAQSRALDLCYKRVRHRVNQQSWVAGGG